MKRADAKNSGNVDLELLVPRGSRLWLEAKMRELASVWGEVVRMHQLLDVKLEASCRNNVFVFQNQQVIVNVNVNRE